MAILTTEELAEQFQRQTAAAAGAGALLAALILALAAAETAENVPHYIRNDLSSQVAELLSTTRGFVDKFQREL